MPSSSPSIATSAAGLAFKYLNLEMSGRPHLITNSIDRWLQVIVVNYFLIFLCLATVRYKFFFYFLQPKHFFLYEQFGLFLENFLFSQNIHIKIFEIQIIDFQNFLFGTKSFLRNRKFPSRLSGNLQRFWMWERSMSQYSRSIYLESVVSRERHNTVASREVCLSCCRVDCGLMVIENLFYLNTRKL